MAEVQGHLEARRQEVRKMINAADRLFGMWRSCRMCGRELIWTEPRRPVRCECGWVRD